MATHSSVLAGESQGRGSLVGCRLWGRTGNPEIPVAPGEDSEACPWFAQGRASGLFRLVIVLCLFLLS